LRTKRVAIEEIFEVRSGDFHAIAELDKGSTPLVSCGETDNGVVGLYDIPKNKTYERCLTVAYNGSWPLLANYHPYRFGAKDDVGVLVPRKPMHEKSLLYVAAMLGREKWRYSYGRKCYLDKIQSVRIPLPMHDGSIDEKSISELIAEPLANYLPTAQKKAMPANRIIWRKFILSDLFDLDHGDFNSYGDFPAGNKMIISRSAENNGLAGYYRPPKDAREFGIGVLTVSTVTGDTFVQLHSFYASDKVVLLLPKKAYKPTTLFLIAFSLNHQKWRFSYGRSCFKRTLGITSVYLPASGSKMDEGAMSDIVSRTSYWPAIKKRFTKP
jgi:hypothetical protein